MISQVNSRLGLITDCSTLVYRAIALLLLQIGAQWGGIFKFIIVAATWSDKLRDWKMGPKSDWLKSVLGRESWSLSLHTLELEIGYLLLNDPAGKAGVGI